MSIFHDHKKLFSVAGALFVTLTFFVAIRPALVNQANNMPLPDAKPLVGDVMEGKKIYIAEGCMGCHTQQVRNVDMDKMFGSRPSIPSDYAGIHRTSVWINTATLTGTERTGPDLTDVGNRQPSKDWHLMHLFNPRSVVGESIMPSYEWLFEIKKNPGKNDVVVNMPAQFLGGREGKVVATKKALQLLAYLQSLKQTPLPDGVKPKLFLYKQEEKKLAGKTGGGATAAEGKVLYEANCQSCHQATGLGLPGAFPPLKSSPIVLGENLELYVDIIMNGYDARPEYATMAAVGTNMNFDENQVAAIINFERTAWGNNGKAVTPEEVKKIMDFVKIKASAK